jgi:hypothetical protein
MLAVSPPDCDEGGRRGESGGPSYPRAFFFLRLREARGFG